MIGAPEMILFSSDYPHWDFDNPKMALPALPSEWKEKIFWRNAAELYGLPVTSGTVSYTHLDVYKRQRFLMPSTSRPRPAGRSA